jgi:hypothetical protein
MNKLTLIRVAVNAANSAARLATTVKTRTVAVYIAALLGKLDASWVKYQDSRCAVDEAEQAVITAEAAVVVAAHDYDVLGAAVDSEIDRILAL